MANTGIQVDGMDQILRRIDALGARGEAVKKEVLFEAGKMVQREVKRKASALDDSIWTKNNEEYGTLEENIWLEWDEQTKTTYISTGNAYWAQFLEYGTKFQTPQPFMEKTLRELEHRIMQMVKEELRRKLGL